MDGLPTNVTGTLAEGRQAYLAVGSKAGPHVTPELYAWSDDRLWFLVATTTLKARAAARQPTAGALVSTRDRSVVLQGAIEVIDPRRPSAWPGHLVGAPAAARAMARYAARNAADLAAFAGDLAGGRLGWRLPPLRVLLRLTPTAAALVEGDAITGRWGSWSGDGGSGPGPVGSVPAGGRPTVVALPGPAAVPGRWVPEDQAVHVLPDLLDLLDVGPACDLGLVVDEYTAPGPAAKRGALHHCRGTVDRAGGVITVEPERVVEWRGVDVSSTGVP